MLILELNAQVFITELADPNNNANVRYIELYNAGSSAVDFTENSGWRIDKYTNASATVSQTLSLTGTIPAGGFYIIATGTDDGDFLNVYGVSADQFDGADNNVAGSNGDDNLELYDGNNTLIDQFGVPGEDGTGTAHEFEDGRAERVATVTQGNATWDVQEWNIDNDSGGGDGTQDAPADFDPRQWIGAANSSATLTWDATTFTEDASNNGTIGNQINLTLSNETWSHSGEDLTPGTDFTVNNVPQGLTVSINAYSSTLATISLTGTADSHLNSDDVNNLEITFTDAAFTGADASAVANSSKSDLVVDFNDPATAPELTWSTTTFTESANNDGSIGTVIDLSLSGDAFATTGTLVSGTDFTVNNVPSGLVVNIITTSSTTGTISLTGNASSHLNSDDIANLEITFTNAAFTSGDASAVINSSKTDIVVDFNDPYSSDLVITEISYNGPESGTDTTEFIEIYNNGSASVNLNNYAVTTAVDYTFGDVNLNAGEYIVISYDSLAMVNTFGVNTYQWSGGLGNGGEIIKLLNPGGMLVDSVKFDDATPWPYGTDGQGHTLVFCDYSSDNSLGENWKISTNYIATNANGDKIWASPMASDYVCSVSPILDWNTTTFNEAAADNGTIETIVDLTLTDDEFATTGTLVVGTDYTVANVPGGLTVEINVTSTTTATVALTGAATNNAANDDISNLEVTFKNAAFVSDYAENIVGYSKTDLVVDFIGVVVPVLTWTNTTFVEAAANDGSIDNTTPLSLKLTDDTFTSVGTLTENTEYTVSNIPNGLVAVVTSITNDSAIVTLTGQAVAHENANDVSDLTITFLDAAFTGGNVSAVQNYENATLVVDFNNAPAVPVLTWNATSFTEDAANNGTFSTDITLTLSDETFSVSGVDLTEGTHFTVANVPPGLTVNVNAYTSTAASITLVGTADSHLSSDNISNLTVTFLDAAFTNSTAAEVVGSSNDTLKVNFLDPYIIPDLVITEIMYNPAESGADSTEFIEIYNNDANNINLNGYYLSGVTYTFGNITINSGNYIVVAVNASAMMNTFGVSTLEWTTGGLSNGGETVAIYNPNADLIDEVAYDDNTAWPNADESGHSLVLCDVTSDNNDPSNWTISTNYVGMNANDERIWASPMADDNICSTSPSLTWSTTTFNEDAADNGSISTIVNLTLSDDEFATVGNLVSGSDFMVNNVPAGLAVEITSTSTTAATIALTGTADNHTNADDISNLEITFTDTAFVSGFSENVTDYSKVDLVVDFIGNVSVNEVKNNEINIYPNPVKDILTIEGKTISVFQIVDVNGQVVFEETNVMDKKSIDVSNLQEGVYFVKTKNNQSNFVAKFVKL